LGWLVQSAFSQNKLVEITNIQEKVNSNLLGIPQKAVYTLEWKLKTNVGLAVRPMNYNLMMQEENSNKWKFIASTQSTKITIPELSARKKYAFVVSLDTTLTSIISDTAEVYSGLRSAPPQPVGSNLSNHLLKHWGWIPFNGRWFLYLSQHGEMFDSSSFLGKICFHGIWNAMLIGVFIVLVFCRQTLSNSKISPIRIPFISFLERYRNTQRRNETPKGKELKELFEAWKSLVKSQRNQCQGSQNNKEILLTKDECELIKKWIKKLDDEFMQYPTARIFRQTLESHYNHGLFSDEVERDFENLAVFELEMLSQDSHYEWLLTISQICPLLGLFGTVTGISASFMEISKAKLSQGDLIQKLSSGIFEALWTTIEGLLFGIAFLFIYNYCHRHIAKINSIWHKYYTELIG
jgi:biopolymer transport protein ExbB/TolQ